MARTSKRKTSRGRQMRRNETVAMADYGFTREALSKAMSYVRGARRAVDYGRLVMPMGLRKPSLESHASQIDHALALVIESAQLLAAAETIALEVDFRDDPTSGAKLKLLSDEFFQVRESWESFYEEFRSGLLLYLG